MVACFNPRARKGRDHGIGCSASPGFGFNPRARKGRDVCSMPYNYDHKFQSTRPQGARRAGIYFGTYFLVSIHAPARGATESCGKPTAFLLFQSTRPQGARQAALRAGRCRKVSIHAPARGATLTRFLKTFCGSFNPRARKGRD